MSRNASAADVQAESPQRPAARRVHTLPLDALRPVIRIAHRASNVLRIPERIIVDHELVLVTRGRGEFTIGGDRIGYEPFDLFVIPPFVPHRIDGGETEHLAVHFDLALDLPATEGSPRDRLPYEVQFPRGLALPRRVRLTEGDANVKRLRDIVALRERGDDLAEIEAVARLTLVIVSLLTDRTEDASSDSIDPRNRVRLERAVAWLRENLHREIGVEDLADAAGLSPSHLRRLFPQWTGYSPNVYVRRARVERARQLLGDVDLTLKEIAVRCGFKDPFHFSKVFRQVDGLPPSRYREALLAGRVDERI